MKKNAMIRVKKWRAAEGDLSGNLPLEVWSPIKRSPGTPASATDTHSSHQ
jgi:hypothetical protein